MTKQDELNQLLDNFIIALAPGNAHKLGLARAQLEHFLLDNRANIRVQEPVAVTMPDIPAYTPTPPATMTFTVLRTKYYPVDPMHSTLWNDPYARAKDAKVAYQHVPHIMAVRGDYLIEYWRQWFMMYTVRLPREDANL